MYANIQQVYDEILAAKAAKAELAGLTTGSATAIWKLWAWVIATVIWSLDKSFEKHTTDTNALLDAKISHNAAWYANQMLLFQYGDTIEVVNYVPQYLVIDETKRIIKRVAVVDSNGAVTFKLAKETAGALVKLTSDEQLAANAYLVKVKDAGVQTQIVSYDADLFKPKLTIFYDAQYSVATMQAAVNLAINNFLKNYNNENFNGQFVRNKFIDALQVVQGVKDLDITLLEFKSVLAGVYTAINRVYDPLSGYIKIDPAYDLNNLTNIAYTPV